MYIRHIEEILGGQTGRNECLGVRSKTHCGLGARKNNGYRRNGELRSLRFAISVSFIAATDIIFGRLAELSKVVQDQHSAAVQLDNEDNEDNFQTDFLL